MRSGRNARPLPLRLTSIHRHTIPPFRNVIASRLRSIVARANSVYRDWLVIYLKGFAMGAADAVPGVSGGTIALITGIYERLIRAITALDPGILTHASGLHRSETRASVVDDLVSMDVPFLVVLGVGMVSAIIVLARVIQAALATVPAVTFAFFAGLIGASAVILFEQEWLSRPTHLLAGAGGFSVAFLVAGASTSGVFPHSLPMIFLAGAIAICGMVLPGISGAFILLLLGQYEYLTAVLTRFTDQFASMIVGGGTGQFFDDGAVVLTFVTGAFLGLVTTAYVVRWALERHRTATFAFLVSLMVGALRYPIVEVGATDPSRTDVLLVILAAVVGVGAVFLLDRYTDDLDYTDESITYR